MGGARRTLYAFLRRGDGIFSLKNGSWFISPLGPRRTPSARRASARASLSAFSPAGATQRSQSPSTLSPRSVRFAPNVHILLLPSALVLLPAHPALCEPLNRRYFSQARGKKASVASLVGSNGTASELSPRADRAPAADSDAGSVAEGLGVEGRGASGDACSTSGRGSMPTAAAGGDGGGGAGAGATRPTCTTLWASPCSWHSRRPSRRAPTRSTRPHALKFLVSPR